VILGVLAQRFTLPVTVARLYVHGETLTAELVELQSRRASQRSSMDELLYASATTIAPGHP